jgi:hypothetical protein
MTKWVYVFYSIFIVFSLVSIFLFDRTVLAGELVLYILSTLFLLCKIRKSRHTDEMLEAENTCMYPKDISCKDGCVSFVSMTKEILSIDEQRQRFAQRLKIMEAKSNLLKQSSAYQRFDDYLKRPSRLSLADDDWEELLQYLERVIPSFQNIKHDIADMSSDCYRICALVRYGFKPSEIATIMGKRNSDISKMRQTLLLKIFHIIGSASEFDTIVTFII